VRRQVLKPLAGLVLGPGGARLLAQRGRLPRRGARHLPWRGFFFDASRGFFGRGANHQRLAFAFIPLALRFHAAVFFQHALAHGQFCLGQGAACAGGAGLARTLTAIIASLRAR